MTPTERRAPPLDVAIGLMVRRARNARDLPPAEFAERAGIDLITLSRIEGGWVTRAGTWGLICKLADALGMPVSTLVKMAEDRIYETPASACPACAMEMPI